MAEESKQLPKHLPKVLVLGRPMVFEIYENHFSQRFQLLKPFEPPIPTHQFFASNSDAASVQAMLCSGLFPVTADLLRQLPSVRLIVTASTGVNHIDTAECRRRGVSVCNAGTVFSEDVADLAVGLVVDVMRKMSAADRFARSGLWPVKGEYPLASKLGGKRVGIIGLGSIGLEVAKRLKAFGCKISYNSRKKKPSISFPFYSNVLELAENCDILVICCALTDQTRHMINKEVLDALGKEGVVVNIGRGAIVDEKELVAYLVQGKIAGAGLDVFENEPEVPEELFDLDNVVLSAHRAVFTEQSFRDSYELMLGNLDAFFANKPLLSPITDE